jgi:hypothetical protein
MSNWVPALGGGALIGAAAGLLLLTHGRIAGISGITASALSWSWRDHAWRWAFLAGLVIAGLVARLVAPAMLGGAARSLPVTILAGLAVGFGTRLGGGCTSGHGVCGIARRSLRSLIAVAVFMTTGAITATLLAVLS